MLLAAGIVGTAAGVWLFTMLRAIDQLDLVIGLSYVALLCVVGVIMIDEGFRAIMRARHGGPAIIRRPGSHTWMHGLPFKLRFKRSKIYVSAIPVWGIGFFMGFIGTIMGIGGGFLLVPMLIYFLRVPTATVIGTSMVLTLATMASATVMHAATNHLVDVVLALNSDDRRRDRRAIRRAHRTANARRKAAAAARHSRLCGRPAFCL